MGEKFGDRFPPSVTAAKLYEKTSAKGNSYLIGRLGAMRVAVIKTQETSDDGASIWELKFSAAPAPKAKTDKSSAPPMQSNQSGFGTRATNDEIPF